MQVIFKSRKFSRISRFSAIRENVLHAGISCCTVIIRKMLMLASADCMKTFFFVKIKELVSSEWGFLLGTVVQIFTINFFRKPLISFGHSLFNFFFMPLIIIISILDQLSVSLIKPTGTITDHLFVVAYRDSGFLAVLSSDLTISTSTAIVFDQTLWNVGGNYDASSGIFTVQIHGKLHGAKLLAFQDT